MLEHAADPVCRLPQHPRQAAVNRPSKAGSGRTGTAKLAFFPPGFHMPSPGLPTTRSRGAPQGLVVS
jgi:hypothetical protein